MKEKNEEKENNKVKVESTYEVKEKKDERKEKNEEKEKSEGKLEVKEVILDTCYNANLTLLPNCVDSSVNEVDDEVPN